MNNSVMARAALSLALVICSATPALAQLKFLQSEADAKRAAEGIVASAAAGNMGGALKGVRELSPVPGREFEAAQERLGEQQMQFQMRAGDPAGYEFLREDRAGQSLIRYQYLVKYQYGAQRWRFIFFKTPEGWSLSQFAFDANLEGAFP